MLVDVGGLPDLVNHLVLGICLEFRIVRHQHKSPKNSAKSFKSRNWNDNLHDLHMDFPYNIKMQYKIMPRVYLRACSMLGTSGDKFFIPGSGKSCCHADRLIEPSQAAMRSIADERVRNLKRSHNKNNFD